MRPKKGQDAANLASDESLSIATHGFRGVGGGGENSAARTGADDALYSAQPDWVVRNRNYEHFDWLFIYGNRLRQLSITSTACDTSSSLTFRLGTSLTQSAPAVSSNTPRSRASSTSRCASPSRISTMPMIKPQPRFGPTNSGNHPESLSSRRSRKADVLLRRATKSRWLSRSSTWNPTEHARGDPPKVVPCVPVQFQDVSADHRSTAQWKHPCTCCHRFSDRISHQHSPNGKPVCQRLRHSHDVWVALHRPPRMCPQGSSSVKPALPAV